MVPAAAEGGAPRAVRGAGAGETLDEERLLAGELRAARKIQMGMVPKTVPPVAGCLPFDLYAILEPAREIGGDFYDFWLNGRENLMLAVGDVSGKGIPAALFMAVCRTYLRAFSHSLGEPAELLEYLNNEISRHNESCMYVTLICGLAHIPTGRLRYASAGHNPPFIRRRDGSVSVLETVGALPVGLMRGTRYETQVADLAAGDAVLFYSDGVPEAFNAARDTLGDDRALELFRKSAAGGCRAAIGQLRAEVSEFVGEAEQSDDITMLMYGQLDPSGTRTTLEAGRECSSDLEGDTAICALSAEDPSRRRAATGYLSDELGQSLSGFSPRDSKRRRDSP